jgi:DnaJ-class molecular chaperone
MKAAEPKEVWREVECPACNGSGFPTVMQPKQPGRKIFPAPCKQCHGKGRIRVVVAGQ